MPFTFNQSSRMTIAYAGEIRSRLGCALFGVSEHLRHSSKFRIYISAGGKSTYLLRTYLRPASNGLYWQLLDLSFTDGEPSSPIYSVSCRASQ